MDSSIIVAIITGGASLLGVIITMLAGNKKIEKKLEIHQAVTDEKIENLTREVRRHNNFAERMPAVEAEISAIKGTIEMLHK